MEKHSQRYSIMNAEDMVQPRWWLCPADAHHGPRGAVVHYYHRWAYKPACVINMDWAGEQNGRQEDGTSSNNEDGMDRS